MKLEQTEIRAALESRRSWAVDSLTEWVRRASTLGNEQSAQEHVAALYEQLGLATKMLPVDHDKISKLPGYSPVDWSYEGRQNVIGVHDPGTNEGQSLVFNGHVDVVSPEPISLWSNPPFEPKVVQNEEDGEEWMYGRGAADMKGGSMCFLWAMAALRDMGLEPASKVIFQSPLEEECTGNGTLALLADGYTADGCLIPEPFNETILLRQVGVIWFDVRILGKTTHVLGAGSGVNAIEKMWVIIQALRELETELNQPEHIPPSYAGIEHPINLNVGTIQGGDWASTVAGECVTRFRLGLFPTDTVEELKEAIQMTVAQAAAEDPWLAEYPPTVEFIGFHAEGAKFDPDCDLGQTLRDAHEEWRGVEPVPLRATCTTDVRFFTNNYDIPATCYGPKCRNIHAADEKVSIDSMQRVAEVMVTFIEQWCGLRKRDGA
ncbi:ArgE/DapE family deacylase [bacterium]|nr:ArgE/DapE family deacylase [bacterium]